MIELSLETTTSTEPDRTMDASVEPPPSGSIANTRLTLPEGATGPDSGLTLEHNPADEGFGELGKNTAEPAVAVTAERVTSLFIDDTEGVPPDGQIIAVDDARRQVREVLDEPADEAAADNGGIQSPGTPLPPTTDGSGHDNEHKDDKNTSAHTETEVPSQRTPPGTTADNVTEMEADETRLRDEAHVNALADLHHLAAITVVKTSPGGRGYDNLRFVFADDNDRDASESLAELASKLRTGSTKLPRITDWQDELSDPDKLQIGQVIEVASLRDLDALLARVGGWLNNESRADRGDALPEPHTGNWYEPDHRPSDLLGNVKDLRGKHFFGTQTNIEAMALPPTAGHTEYSRYFTVSSQLKSTGKPPESSRPMRLVSVTAIPIKYTSDRIISRFTEIGRVPASVTAWVIDSHSRQTGHDVEFNARANPFLGGTVNRR